MRRALAIAVDDLAARDAVFSGLVARHGPCRLRGVRPPAERFESLTRAICAQQVAGAAARAIHGRFLDVFGGEPTPEGVLARRPTTLRSIGLSGAKEASIRDLARKVADGEVRLDRLARYDDERVITELTTVRGIGRWTAEMFLMFQLGRLDVWPTGDYGVRKGFGAAWGLPVTPGPDELEPRGDAFRPYRSVVAWYCWRAAGDPVAADGS